MSKVYVVVSGALQEFGEFCKVRVEKVFDTRQKAEAFFKNNTIIWNEKIDNVNYSCERSVAEVEVE